MLCKNAEVGKAMQSRPTNSANTNVKLRIQHALIHVPDVVDTIPQLTSTNSFEVALMGEAKQFSAMDETQVQAPEAACH